MSHGDGSEHVPAKYRRAIERESAIKHQLPQLYAFWEKRIDDFNGFSILIGNSGGFLAILKQLDSDGRPQVMFSYGDSPLEAIFACEAALAKGLWREDKPRKAPAKT